MVAHPLPIYATNTATGPIIDTTTTGGAAASLLFPMGLFTTSAVAAGLFNPLLHPTTPLLLTAAAIVPPGMFLQIMIDGVVFVRFF